MPGSSAQVTIARLRDVSQFSSSAHEAIGAIFAETSGAKHFDTQDARVRFRERWLGRYLAHYPDEVFIALADGQEVVGYLVGCLDDPARNQLFSDISYFADFAHLTRHYPAHLHINLTARWRGQGIGKRLVAAFANHAAEADTMGMHVVTGEGARNNGFYRSCGFRQLGSAIWQGSSVAFFGRELARSGPGGARLSQPGSLG